MCEYGNAFSKNNRGKLPISKQNRKTPKRFLIIISKKTQKNVAFSYTIEVDDLAKFIEKLDMKFESYLED